MSSHGGAPRIVKKYGNRRLYDTTESRYVTLEELAVSIKGGAEVRVVDAQTGQDLTQTTLAQIILEGRGAAQFLSVPILTQLVRMNDDALADFFGRWLSAALELYQGARQGVQALTPYNPLAAVPFAASNAIARLFTALPGPWMSAPSAPQYASSAPQYTSPAAPPYAPYAPPPPDPHGPPPTTPPPPPGADREALAALRRELDALKYALGAHSPPPPPPPAPTPLPHDVGRGPGGGARKPAAKPARKPAAKPAAKTPRKPAAKPAAKPARKPAR